MAGKRLSLSLFVRAFRLLYLLPDGRGCSRLCPGSDRSSVHVTINQSNPIRYGTIAFIGLSIEYKCWEIMLQLYTTLVRPHLENCVQFWSPHYQKDMEALEGVQRRFTGMLPGLEGVGYEERLNKLGLFSLERWRLRGDLIEVYKIIRGIDRVDSVISLRWQKSLHKNPFIYKLQQQYTECSQLAVNIRSARGTDTPGLNTKPRLP